MRSISKVTSVTILCGLAALVLAQLWGCTDRIKGEQTANQKPVVWFVNIPPENSSSSINPIINWVGQDRDGQIKYFRYVVIREKTVGDFLGKAADWMPSASDTLTKAEIASYVANGLGSLADTMWTYLYVKSDEADPKTSNIVPMQAEVSDPVLTFVPQIVFLQAFDELFLGSDIAFRRFYRNDNPPNTRIVGFVEDVPFINSADTGLASTGIRIRWSGSDVLDYPTDDPPMDFQWKLFGPYDDATFEAFMDSFVVPVFVTNDAQIYRMGLPDVTICDTFETGGIIDSIVCNDYPTAHIVCDTSFPGGDETINCDTILITENMGTNVYGRMDMLVRVLDDDFINSPQFNIVADSSEVDSLEAANSDASLGDSWMAGTRDSMFNVYSQFPADTSREMHYMFWVRSRDDALVPDPTPDYRTFTVIDPKHERDLLVIDMGITYPLNRGNFDSAKSYWDVAVNKWIDSRPEAAGVLDFDPAKDFINIAQYQGQPEFLRFLLGHKVVILLNDDIIPGIFARQGTSTVGNIYVAMQTGVNVWLSMRMPLGTYPEGGRWDFDIDPPPSYQFFFGTQKLSYSGWSHFVRKVNRDLRIEDFIGAISLDTEHWPHLSIDTAHLHARYRWSTVYYWSKDAVLDSVGDTLVPAIPPYGALPEVNWAVRSPETEAMYLYNSLYGNEHFLGPDWTFYGRPVVHRLNRGIFRSIHMLFTPMAFKDATMQLTVNANLDWLYDGFMLRHGGVAAGAGKERPIRPTTASAMNDRYWNAYWRANGDADEFYRIIGEGY